MILAESFQRLAANDDFVFTINRANKEEQDYIRPQHYYILENRTENLPK
jgi:hypothetical protein